MTYKQLKANHEAWKIWQDARKTAASHQNIEEWQRLNKAVDTLQSKATAITATIK